MSVDHPETASPAIYIVDDDPILRSLLQSYLQKNGLDATALAGADDLFQRMQRRRPQLIVMDLMMPGTTGLEALRRLRGTGDDIPLILLTARSDEVDRIVGLELGADDYIGKPFNPRELLARIQAVLRRHKPSAAGVPDIGSEPVEIGEFVLDHRARSLSDGVNEVLLSSGEYALLKILLAHAGQALSRERLLELLHGNGSDNLERAIDVQILRLRRLVEVDPQRPRLIQTVRGAGYVFVPQPRR